MIKLDHLLMATDFSACSKEALYHAVHLAGLAKAKLTLLHVFESPFFYPTEISGGVYPEVYNWIEDFKRGEQKQLKLLADALQKEGIEVDSLFKEGTPFVEISQTAKEIGADLIVLGTHGRKGLSHMMMGSVAERVTREAPCPVLVVREKKNQDQTESRGQ